MIASSLRELSAALASKRISAVELAPLYLDRIERLNRAGLDHMQISIDNVMPDDVSKKSLKVLDQKLRLLAEYTEFHVNINSVVGGGIHNPDDALVVGGDAEFRDEIILDGTDDLPRGRDGREFLVEAGCGGSEGVGVPRAGVDVHEVHARAIAGIERRNFSGEDGSHE